MSMKIYEHEPGLKAYRIHDLRQTYGEEWLRRFGEWASDGLTMYVHEELGPMVPKRDVDRFDNGRSVPL